MKDGEIAEIGKHAELIANKGEYAKLYNIQANAFLADASDLPAPTPPGNTGHQDGHKADYSSD